MISIAAREQLHAAFVIGRRQILESFLTPGFYIILSLGLAIASLLVAGFAGSVDSSGFNPQASPFYDLITRSLTGAFGAAFVEKLFAQGPFLFALLCGFTPVAGYLAAASVVRFGQEKAAGAVELLAYGPADGGSYLAAVFIKDLVLSLCSLAAMALALLAAAAIFNMVAGPLFFWSLAVLFLVSGAFFAYGILCSVLLAGSSSALALFIGLTLAFFVVLAGSFTIVSAPVRTISSAAGAVVSWISPFSFAGIFYRGVEAGTAAGTAAGLLLLAVLTAALLAAGLLAVNRKGVRS